MAVFMNLAVALSLDLAFLDWGTKAMRNASRRNGGLYVVISGA
jgi:hypothetical protein